MEFTIFLTYLAREFVFKKSILGLVFWGHHAGGIH